MGDGILIVCGKKDFADKLGALASSGIPGGHSVALTGAEARRKTGLSEYGAVLVADRIPDENMIDLAADLAESGCSGVMIIVGREALYEAHEALDGTGVTILVRPITKDALVHTVKLVERVREGGGTFEKAKLMLVQKKDYSEQQAHKYIQKISMDKRIPRDVAATLIIRALEK